MVSSSSWPIAAASTILLIAQCTNSFTTSPLATNISSRQQEQQSTSQLRVSSAPTTTTEYDIVKVDLTDGRDYPIYIGSDFSNDESSELLQQHVVGKRALLITNDKIAPLYLEQYKALLEKDGNVQVDTVVLPDGEEHKTFDCMAMILDKALELGLDRKCTFVALGGGVIGDMVGFASAIYQRGVNFIQIPTTVMAMVDSSVGGKTGVCKNMIGSFHQPQCVFINTNTLDTLPDRELKSGISEIVKYGLIRDAPFFQWQEENMEKLLKRDPDVTR